MNIKVTSSQDAWLKFGDDEIIPLETQFNIGRSSSCKLVIANDEVSREHALLQYEETGNHWMIIDMGSTNGTYVIKAEQSPLFIRRESISIDQMGKIGAGWMQTIDDPDIIYFTQIS